MGTTACSFPVAEELAKHLVELLEGFPFQPSGLLTSLQHRVAAANALSWDASWESIVKPLVLK